MLAITEDKAYRTKLYTKTAGSGFGSKGARLKTAEWLIEADSANDAEVMAIAYAAEKFGGSVQQYEAHAFVCVTREVLAEV